MIETLSAFWDFLKKPKLLKLSKDNKSLWRDLLWLLLLDLIFAGIIMGIYYILVHFKIIKEYVQEIDILEKYGLTVTLLLVCIFAPVLEEFLFRWHLRKKYLSIYFVCFTLGLISNYFIKSSFLTWPVYIFFLFVALIVHGYFKRIDIRKRLVFQQKSFGYLFYYSAIIFGLTHLGNIKGLTLSNPTFILFVISQTFTGISLGFIRIKYGLGYSMLLHGFFNFILLLLTVFFS
ncbi:CPBP family glutamic-type intramembrane protease [Pedobacter sp. PF22-3]|uniref:CPBP family glutamic-type intramembrane protease n=1 Tax=Pedobacter sp. PF22-3 TaxID=2994467 RepID=UPI002246607A|nr:CPBP family glutamic-type intramembrane protease [Pedobacter sp. PF22-3]MCX2494229.1 CPBP family glutamic-type intramembrane protease [Pedobacter sp. PF22-3]